MPALRKMSQYFHQSLPTLREPVQQGAVMHTLPNNPPPSPAFVGSTSFFRGRVDLAEPQAEVFAQLPSDWDQLDPDQRVREIGEW